MEETEQRCSDLPLRLRGARDCGQLALFCVFFSFAQQGGRGHRSLASPHGASEIATMLLFFPPRRVERWRFRLDNSCCVCCRPGGKRLVEEIRQRTTGVRAIFCDEYFWGPFLQRWRRRQPPPPHSGCSFFFFLTSRFVVGGCSWCRVNLSLPALPFSVLLFIRDWWKGREEEKLYLGRR